jgi:hypothetical protein
MDEATQNLETQWNWMCTLQTEHWLKIICQKYCGSKFKPKKNLPEFVLFYHKIVFIDSKGW